MFGCVSVCEWVNIACVFKRTMKRSCCRGHFGSSATGSAVSYSGIHCFAISCPRLVVCPCSSMAAVGGIEALLPGEHEEQKSLQELLSWGRLFACVCVCVGMCVSECVCMCV